MAKIKQKVNITDTEDSRIRRTWDSDRQRWYFSITDVMAILTESVDARNYWKALKNRLKISHNQLVMNCNQLKMKSSDGKSYMVDVADADGVLKIIQIIAPYNVPAFKSWFDHIDVQNSISKDTSSISGLSPTRIDGSFFDLNQTEISTALEPAIDIYENKSDIVVKLFLAGVNPDKIILGVSMKTLTIKGARIQSENISEENYFQKELQWGEFYRQVELPSFVDVDQIEATEQTGLITIKLTKIDPDKNRFIKIKSLS